jgi:hypothetical protein
LEAHNDASRADDNNCQTSGDATFKMGRKTMAAFTSHPNPKYFFFHPLHQIFRRMHGALNVGKKDN